uniref:Uncharacterized protein n=1 Tax=Arion vulgaris TaxID=1028688 RepID=A0A0B6ZWB5_9EUPU
MLNYKLLVSNQSYLDTVMCLTKTYHPVLSRHIKQQKYNTTISLVTFSSVSSFLLPLPSLSLSQKYISPPHPTPLSVVDVLVS